MIELDLTANSLLSFLSAHRVLTVSLLPLTLLAARQARLSSGLITTPLSSLPTYTEVRGLSKWYRCMSGSVRQL